MKALIIVEYLLLCLPTIVHLIVDRKGKVIHWLNALYVVAISIVVGMFLPHYFWQGSFYALTIHFAFFDPLYNLMKGHAWNYHGSLSNPDIAWTDKQWQKYGHPLFEIFFRLWVLSLGIGVYYHLDLIIGN